MYNVLQEKPSGVQVGGIPTIEYSPALERGIVIMRAFSGQPSHLTLREISRLSGLSCSIVRRCLATLEWLGYINLSGKYYCLTPRVLTLSRAYFSSNPLPCVAQLFIEEASGILGEACSVSVFHGNKIIYIARSSQRSTAYVHRDVGLSIPAYCTSMGRVLLSNLTSTQLDTYFRLVTLKRFTKKTIIDEVCIRTILKEVKLNEYCAVDGEFECNLRAVAVPVRNISGNVIAAASISMNSDYIFERAMQKKILSILQEAVARMRPLLLD